MVYFKENYCLPSFQRGAIVFPRGGGGLFFCTYDFPGGPHPTPPLNSRMHLFLQLKVIFLAPFNYVETH